MKYEKNTNYQYFVNELLDDVIMESDKITNYTFFENNAQFTFDTVNGKVDFYPTTDKINFRNADGWQSDGLKTLLAYAGSYKKYVYVVQDIKTMIINGCFNSEDKANRFISNSDNFCINKIEVI